ncbi:MAG: hypothetical protein BTN85_2198 [Candidatus Methanohalarchaeum thermophilum]|uniref:Uncharacterized protein n=1 Tax=Methanohalarchaeum thermophilum TaxID=1903181 RepID=A0A1Q6DRR2_METT1|nr:MAG: hypothetical protein BTN85_2197 [Candidatus Methanohalarchaeum thermophilum]OKY77075.1 MAG: hypothetical protein BTN85_2198 [Candidatus Methanohalarchaeum thermophilum]
MSGEEIERFVIEKKKKDKFEKLSRLLDDLETFKKSGYPVPEKIDLTDVKREENENNQDIYKIKYKPLVEEDKDALGSLVKSLDQKNLLKGKTSPPPNQKTIKKYT